MKNKFLFPLIAFGIIGCAEADNDNSAETETKPAQSEIEQKENKPDEGAEDEIDVLTPIEATDQLAKEIDGIGDWDEKEFVEVNESTEGGELNFYSKDGQLTLITEHHYGEMGQKQNSYYFNNDGLKLFKEKVLNYNAPFYMEGEFDPTQTDTVIKLCYFDQGQLTHLINETLSEETLSQTDYRQNLETDILDRLQVIMANLKN